MGEKERIEVLKKRGMTQSEAEGFVARLKEGLQARKEGNIKLWSEISVELTKDCPECGKE